MKVHAVNTINIFFNLKWNCNILFHKNSASLFKKNNCCLMLLIKEFCCYYCIGLSKDNWYYSNLIQSLKDQVNFVGKQCPAAYNYTLLGCIKMRLNFRCILMSSSLSFDIPGSRSILMLMKKLTGIELFPTAPNFKQLMA